MSSTYIQELEIKPLRRSYYELAKSLCRAGSWQQARGSLQSALKTEGDDVPDWEIYRLMAEALKAEGNNFDANMYLLQAIALAPKHEAEIFMANYEPETKFGNSPNVDYDEALLLMGEAEMYRKEKNWKQARSLTGQALQIAIDKNETERADMARLSLAEIDYEEGAFDNALQNLQTLTGISEGSARLLLKGKCLLGKSGEKPPVEVLTIADNLIASCNLPEAHVLRMQYYIYESQYKKALEAVHHALLSQPSNPDLLFYKMQILVEDTPELEEGRQLFSELRSKHGIDFIIGKLEDPYLRFRTHHGNDNFFLAQVYHWLPESFTLTQAMEQANQSLTQGVRFDSYQYPHGLVYNLKAQLYEDMGDKANAAYSYYSAGKEFYWNRFYPKAEKLFAKANELDATLIDNHRYYADTKVMLSFIHVHPFVEKGYLDEGFRIWHHAYQLQVPGYNDAWSYLTLARAYDQLTLLEEVRFPTVYSAWLAVEKALILRDLAYLGWSLLSRFLRDMEGMDYSAYKAAKKSEELYPDDTNTWEELAAIALNLGYLDEAAVTLEKLLKEYPSAPGYQAWKGFGLYLQRKYEEAIPWLDKSIEGDPTWVWPIHLRVICNWLLNDEQQTRADATRMLAYKEDPRNDKSQIDFAFSYFVLGQTGKAIEMCQAVVDQREYRKLANFYLFIYNETQGNGDKALQHLEAYFENSRGKREIEELLVFHNKVNPSDTRFTPMIQEKLEQQSGQEPSELKELDDLFQREQALQPESSDGWLAVALARFRLYLQKYDWYAALQEANVINRTRPDYPDGIILYNKYLLALQNTLGLHLQRKEKYEYWSELERLIFAIDCRNTHLADTWLMASVYARASGERDFSAQWEKTARELYASVDGKEFSSHAARLKETYPYLSPYLEEMDGVNEDRICQYCGAKVSTHKQRFCLNCEAELN